MSTSQESNPLRSKPEVSTIGPPKTPSKLPECPFQFSSPVPDRVTIPFRGPTQSSTRSPTKPPASPKKSGRTVTPLLDPTRTPTRSPTKPLASPKKPGRTVTPLMDPTRTPSKKHKGKGAFQQTTPKKASDPLPNFIPMLPPPKPSEHVEGVRITGTSVEFSSFSSLLKAAGGAPVDPYNWDQLIHEPEPAAFEAIEVSPEEVEVAPLTEEPSERTASVSSEGRRRIEDFQTNLPAFHRILMDLEYDDGVNQPCSCDGQESRGARLVRCEQCPDPSVVCAQCFLDRHRWTWTHWAEVWNPSLEIFQKTSISDLSVPFYPQLGHQGAPCPSPTNTVAFIVVDVHGIHRIRIRFCDCQKGENNPHFHQLLRARLFPNTTSRPQIAFSLEWLRHFQLIHTEGALSTAAMMAAWQRITDNAYPWSVADLVKQAGRVFRIFKLVKAERRAGKIHDIHVEIPTRPRNHLIVLCPACPEVGFNVVPEEYVNIAEHLKHVCRIEKTLDGNFKQTAGAHTSNNNDIDLIGGDGLYPVEEIMPAYRDRIVTPNDAQKAKAKQKIICNDHKSQSTADKNVRSKSMQYNGVLQCQCSHVFVCSTVEIPKGEDHKSADMALYLGLERSGLNNIKQGDPVPPQVYCYDSMCGYSTNLTFRFENTPELSPLSWLIGFALLLIGAAHVYAHVDVCKYIFGPFYILCAAHFHGETAEHFWAIANKFASIIFQMNRNHGHEVYFHVAMDWNWKKYINFPNQLHKEIEYAYAQHLAFKREFDASCIRNAAHIKSWRAEWAYLGTKACEWTRDGKDVVSPYKHRTLQMPSMDEAIATYNKNPIVMPSLPGDDKVNRSGEALSLLIDGLKLEKEQRDLRRLINKVSKYPSLTEKELIARTRLNLTGQLEVWIRRATKTIASYVFLTNGADFHGPQLTEGNAEDWSLVLPSHLSPMERQAVSFLVDAETKLREGAAYEAARMAVIMADALRKFASDKVLHGEEVAEAMARLTAGIATKSTSALRQLEWERNKAIGDWNAHRSALDRMGTLDQSMLKGLPEMVKKDTFRTRSVDGPRLPGDSHIHETSGYQHVRAIATQDMARRGGEQARFPNAENGQRRIEADVSRKRSRAADDKGDHHAKPQKLLKTRNEPTDWLHELTIRGNKNASEIEEWLVDGERVQFFRLEAEALRFLEKVEKTQSEMLRCIRSWTVTQKAWSQRAVHYRADGQHGHATFARQQAHMHQEMIGRMKDKLYSAGYGHILFLPEGQPFWKHVQDVREGKSPLRMSVEELVEKQYVLPEGLAEKVQGERLASEKRKQSRANRRETPKQLEG